MVLCTFHPLINPNVTVNMKSKLVYVINFANKDTKVLEYYVGLTVQKELIISMTVVCSVALMAYIVSDL